MNKNRGFTLIELVFFMFLVSFTIIGIYFTYSNYIEKTNLDRNIMQVISLFKKYEKDSYLNNKINYIYFDLENRIIFFEKDTVFLNSSYFYTSKNISDKSKFSRYFTEKGNINKGFTIVIKKREKIIREVSFDSINGIYTPIIRVRDYE